MVDMAFHNRSFFGMRIFCEIWYILVKYFKNSIYFLQWLVTKDQLIFLQWVYLSFYLLEYTQLVNYGSFWEIFHTLLNTPLNIFLPGLYV